MRFKGLFIAVACITAFGIGLWVGFLPPGNPDLHAIKSFYTPSRGITLHFVQGKHTLLFATLTRLRALQLDTDGTLHERQVSIEGRPAFGPNLSFPEFSLTDESLLVPMRLYGIGLPSSTGRTMSEWLWLWAFNVKRMWLHPIVQCDEAMPVSYVAVVRQGSVPVFSCVPADATAWGEAKDLNPMLLNLRDGSTKPIERITHSRIAMPYMILLNDGYVAIESSESKRWSQGPIKCYLAHNGRKVAENVDQILGATPDLKWIFFPKTRVQSVSGGVASKDICAYNPTTRELRTLVRDWSGGKFRVSQKSNRFGFLSRQPRARTNEGPHPFDAVKVFDLNGNVIEQHPLKQPIKSSTCDWDPDWRLLAYFDGPCLKIMSLEGRLVQEVPLDH